LAVAGIYRQGIVSRLAGLAETVTQNVTTKETPVDLSALSDEDLEQMEVLLTKAGDHRKTS